MRCRTGHERYACGVPAKPVSSSQHDHWLQQKPVSKIVNLANTEEHLPTPTKRNDSAGPIVSGAPLADAGTHILIEVPDSSQVRRRARHRRGKQIICGKTSKSAIAGERHPLL